MQLILFSEQKVRTRHDAVPAKATTLQLLVTEEKAEKATTATQGLLWLLRGLEFTCKALQIAQADTSKELSAAFTEAYGVTLKQYHNFVVKGIFAVCQSRASISHADPAPGRDEGLPLPQGLLCQIDFRP